MSVLDPRMEFYQRRVRVNLRQSQRPLTSKELAQITGLNFEMVQSAVCLLIVSGEITQSHRDQDGKPAYVLSNHLPDGEELPHV